MASAPSPRRIGSPDSGTRAQLLDAAERLMREEGYAAVTSRRIATAAGLKHQLVHYYFRTMDDLFIELFRRRAEENLGRFEQAIADDGSLGNLWRLNADPRGAAFTMEFVALANHRKALRAEIASSAERFRSAQVEAMEHALANAELGEEQVPAIVALLAMTGLAQVLGLEEALGVTTGHDTTIEFVERTIGRLEARSAPSAGDDTPR